MELQTSVDNVKKGRMLGLAAIISLSIIIIQLINVGENPSSTVILIRSGIYFLVTYLGLIWALRFQVTLNSLMYILPQSAFFVFSEYLFLEFFFFRRVGRVYEIFILLVAIAVVFIATYASFLMANIFNVATIKDIPLVNVGKTVSYILSLLTVYFLTYGLLDSGTSIFILVPLLGVGYVFTTMFHFRRVELSKDRVGRVIFLSIIALFVTIIGASFVSSRHELISLLPTIVLFAITGVVTKNPNEEVNFKLASYLILILLVFTFLIFQGLSA